MQLWDSFAGEILMTFLISMTPVLELRGAIPVATAHGLSLGVALVAAIAGNLVPVPFIIIFIRRIFAWIRHKTPRLNGVLSRLEARAATKSALVQRYSFIGLFILVAIPLPGTGAWTGALIAAMLNMRLKHALPAIALGVVAAAVIVAFVSYGAGALLFN